MQHKVPYNFYRIVNLTLSGKGILAIFIGVNRKHGIRNKKTEYLFNVQTAFRLALRRTDKGNFF